MPATKTNDNAMIEINRSLPGASAPIEPIPVKIVGIGGAGSSALDRMLLDGVDATDLVAVNTDVQSLTASVAAQKIQLGNALTHGLGAGGDPEVGMQATEVALPAIHEAIEGAKIVFLVAGLGGGTGSGAAPLIASAARDDGALVIGIVTLPFTFEGRRRGLQARSALDQLRRICHSVIVFENDRMSELIVPKAGIQQAFIQADHCISECIRALLSMVARPGVIKVGIDEVFTALKNRDPQCVFGHGESDGDNRAHEALARALKNPLMERGKLLEEAANVLVYIAGASSLTLAEVEMIMTELNRHIKERTQILLGASIDARLGNKLTVTILSSVGSNPPQEYVPLSLPGRQQPAAEDPVAQSASMPERQIEIIESVVSVVVDEPDLPSKTELPAELIPAEPKSNGASSKKGKEIHQQDLQFENVSRGRFEKSEPTIVEGHDLDVPTILRKGFRV
ncbi:MAG TPA: cell division protein FtsZ [Chthoniobacterales bacterium]